MEGRTPELVRRRVYRGGTDARDRRSGLRGGRRRRQRRRPARSPGEFPRGDDERRRWRSRGSVGVDIRRARRRRALLLRSEGGAARVPHRRAAVAVFRDAAGGMQRRQRRRRALPTGRRGLGRAGAHGGVPNVVPRRRGGRILVPHGPGRGDATAGERPGARSPVSPVGEQRRKPDGIRPAPSLGGGDVLRPPNEYRWLDARHGRCAAYLFERAPHRHGVGYNVKGRCRRFWQMHIFWARFGFEQCLQGETECFR